MTALLTNLGVGAGERFKNTYKLLHLRALKFSPVDKIYSFQCMCKDILCGISKGTFEIAYKISFPYIERYEFLYNIIEILRALRFKSSYAFLNPKSSILFHLFGWLFTYLVQREMGQSVNLCYHLGQINALDSVKPRKSSQ